MKQNTNFKIYNLSSVNSAPPYLITGHEEHLTKDMCVWKNAEPHWKKIGTVPTLEIARFMVTQNLADYADENQNKYSLKTDPSDEYYCSFVKIESENFIEYYDIYNQSHKFQLRKMNTVILNHDFSTTFAFETLRTPVWNIEKNFEQWRKSRQNFPTIFQHKRFSKTDRKAQKKCAVKFRKMLDDLINTTETSITLLKNSKQLEKYEINHINEVLELFATSFLFIQHGYNESPYKNKKNVSIKKYMQITNQLFKTVDNYNSRYSSKLKSQETIFSGLTERWNFLASSANEKGIKNANQKLAEKNLKIKERFSAIEKLSQTLISDFWEWKELHSPDDFTWNNELQPEQQKQEATQFQKINKTITDIQQKSEQILSTSISFVVMSPVIRKEIETSFSIITLTIKTFISLHRKNTERYQKLNEINVKLLKQAESKLQVAIDYYI